MKTIEKFKQINPELELVKNDEMHRELHKVCETWNIFINRSRGVVEVHDTAILYQADEVSSYIFEEPCITWKIVHDAVKFNSNVFDAVKWFEEQDRLQDKQIEGKERQRNLMVRKIINDALWNR